MIDLATVRAFLEAEHLELGPRAHAFGERELARHAAQDDDEAVRRRAREICRLLGEGGWLASVARQDFRSCCVIREVLAFHSPLADAMFALQALGSTPIALAGDDAQRRRWLDGAVRGETIAAFAMTEPQAGSDVSAMRSTAVREGDVYVLNGTKTFISNAGIADFYLLFALTDPAAGTRGMSAFLLPADTPGFRFVRPLVMADPHPLGEIALEDCRLPVSARVGEEGEGFKLGLATLDRLRPTVGAAACGMAGRALHEALEHALTREQFGQRLADFQITQEKLGRMSTDLAAARLLVYRAAWERDGGEARTDVQAAMAKSFATETAQTIVDDAVQILGGRGVLADHPVDRLYRSVRALRIYEGATEIQRLIIARHLIDGRIDDGSAA
ncbi:MAG: acyl-CoA dehydrogenase family protein [Gemmatimonadetes bacterium]|nr:acyl-CoA dehydrogenase family protein [Gemmatimonadota bacterium]